MTIKELLEMEIHEIKLFDPSEHCFRIVIRVPGGWIYEAETPKNGAYPGGITSCFVPEPSLQTITHTNNGYDEWLKTLEPDMPEPKDYDKTVQTEKDFLTMGKFN